MRLFEFTFHEDRGTLNQLKLSANFVHCLCNIYIRGYTRFMLMFYVIIRTNNDYFPKEHFSMCLYDVNGLCSVRGTKCGVVCIFCEFQS